MHTHSKTKHRHAATYRGFRQVVRSGNWYCPNLYGDPCTVFLGKYDSWGIIVDGELLGEWFDDPYQAVDWAIDEVDDTEPPDDHAPPTPSCITFFNLDVPFTETQLKQRYRQMAITHHPDRGGNAKQFIEVQRNFEEALAWL